MADPSRSSSMLSFMPGWGTPASLFLFLNLVIGIIALVSRFGSHRKPQEGGDHHHQLARAPSLLQRVRSIDFSFYKFPPPQESDYTTRIDPPQLERAPSLLQRVKSINFSPFYRSEPELTHLADEPESDQNPGAGHYSGLDSEVGDHHVKRSKSEHMEATKRQQQEVPGKMKKSASERMVLSLDDDDDNKQEEEGLRVERRRPATTRLGKTALLGDEGVDAKADDFINRFKQQLKLQRLDSLLRYKDMLKGKKI